MASPKTAPLEPKIVDRLLDLLGDSDKFRALFQRDPGYALELIGHEEPAHPSSKQGAGALQPTIAGCCAVQQLASKEAIRAARNELKTMLLGGLAQISPGLDATYKGS
jgi:putative modified peptide